MSCAELSDEQILKVIEPMMDDIILGSMRRDYRIHTQHFSIALKGQIGTEEFLAQCDEHRKQWGAAGERQVLCIFRKEKSFTVVWQQNFDNTDEQVALVATVALKGGRYFIDRFAVF